MTEHRASARRRTLKAGTIAFGGGGIDCLVRNLSDTGACLEVESPVGIPNDFALAIQGDSTRHTCHVAWRSARRIGVHFE